MESEIKTILRVANLLGFLFGAGISIAASNTEMLIGVVATTIVIAVATPAVSRYWAMREEVPSE